MKTLSIVTLLMLLSLSACNTLRGVGSDLREAGDRLEKATDK